MEKQASIGAGPLWGWPGKDALESTGGTLPALGLAGEKPHARETGYFPRRALPSDLKLARRSTLTVNYTTVGVSYSTSNARGHGTSLVQ